MYRESPIHHAAQYGKVEVIKILLKHGADPKAKSKYFDWTALFYAIRDNNEEAVKLLLEPCGGAFIQDEDGWTPLHTAARLGKAHVMGAIFDVEPRALEHEISGGRRPLHFAYDEKDSIVWLLDHGAEIDARTKEGKTTLMIAAENGEARNVDLLLQNNAKIQLVDNVKRTAAHWAAQAGNYEIAKKLLDHDDTENPDDAIDNYQDSLGRTVLHISATDRDSETAVDLLLQPKPCHKKSFLNPDIQDQEGNTPLLLAVKEQNVGVVERLLDFNANAEIKNKNGDAPLLLAVKERENDIVKRLLKFGVNVETRNECGETPLLVAIKQGSKNIWKTLLDEKRGADVNNGDIFHPTALHFLAFEGDLDTIKELVKEHKADVNARGGLYDTPLQAAAAGGFDEIVEFLLDKEIGADPGLTGGVFGHALSAAAFSGLIRSAQDIDNLISEEKLINHQDAQGRSSLHIAAWRGNAEVFRILRSKGADVSLLDRQGRSVIHHAAIGGSVDILHQLLSDADTLRLNKPDGQGWMPLHWACRTEANCDAVSRLADGAGDSWAQILTPQGWTPESIAAFHNALELIPEEKRTQRWGIGYCHWAYECDGCQQHPIYGIMFHYNASKSLDFCFKCAWTCQDTYPHYDFETIPRGKGAETRPVVIMEERNIDSMGEDDDSY